MVRTRRHREYIAATFIISIMFALSSLMIGVLGALLIFVSTAIMSTFLVFILDWINNGDEG